MYHILMKECCFNLSVGGYVPSLSVHLFSPPPYGGMSDIMGITTKGTNLLHSDCELESSTHLQDITYHQTWFRICFICVY